MPRFYKPISKDEFLDKIRDLMEQKEDTGFSETYPNNMPKRLDDDLKKVSFDWENSSSWDDQEPFDKNRPEGYYEVTPGFHVWFAWAGGDWEYPLTWIYYWGSKELRAYIPSDGNVWNKKEKCAYGSELDGDGEYEHEEVAKEFDFDKMIADIQNRIKLK